MFATRKFLAPLLTAALVTGTLTTSASAEWGRNAPFTPQQEKEFRAKAERELQQNPVLILEDKSNRNGDHGDIPGLVRQSNELNQQLLNKHRNAPLLILEDLSNRNGEHGDIPGLVRRSNELSR